MERFHRRAERGLSLHNVNLLLAAASLLIAALFLLTAYQISDRYQELRDAAGKFAELRTSAYDLQAASDYLTEQVRFFAFTGERNYLDNYFHEAKDLRRRDRALENLRSVSEAAEAYQRLELAMNESLELMETEYLSMHLAALGYGLELSDFPQEVREAPLPEDCLGLSPEAQRETAQSLLLGEAYRDKKADISRNMHSCLAELMRELSQWESELGNGVHGLIVRLQIMVFVLIAMVLLRILVTSRLVIGPLLTGVLYIQEGQQLPIRGAYELRFLARTYNQMFQENKAQTEQLAYEAMHDKLTGVYNRSGYEQLMASTDLAASALLLVDVDRFKSVNDTYGHKTGDRALVRVSEELRSSFPREAYICRIGGDEFSVILPNAGPERRESIEKAVRQINGRLRRAAAGLPPLSISVGCAFGGTEHSSGALDKDADLALYRVKEAGRCGCAFY